MINLNQAVLNRHTARTFPNFSWTLDIVNYDGPLISLYRDKRGKEALCCWLDCNTTRNRWCLVPIQRDLLRQYLTFNCSLRDVFSKTHKLFVFETTANGSRHNFLEVATKDFPSDYLPEEDSYLVPEACTDSALTLVEMETDNYYLGIDGELYIDDLSHIPRAYQQLYAFHYALKLTGIDQIRNKLAELLRSWKGGIDAVHMFTGFKNTIPSIHRAQLRELRYNSPGHIELNLLPDIAQEIEATLLKITSEESYKASEALYSNIYAFFKAEGIQGFDTEEQTKSRSLSKSAESQLASYITQFLELMGWVSDGSPLESIDTSNLQQLRMLLAYYRRLKKLRPYVAEGNLSLGKSQLRT